MQNSQSLGFWVPDLVRTCPQDRQASEWSQSHQGSREQGSKTSNRNDTSLNPREKKKKVKLDNKVIDQNKWYNANSN